MIIWRGWGILTVVTLFGGLLLAQLAVDAVAGDGTYESNSFMFGGLGLVVGGIATYFLGRWLDRRDRPRNLVDEATGERVVMQARNDLFWVSMRTWGLIGIVAGVTMFLLGVYELVF